MKAVFPAPETDAAERRTYSASQPSSGSLQLDASTGEFTFTPASGASDTVIINFTASDGVKTSNVGSLVIDGYQVETDPQTGNPYIQYNPMPYAGPNIGYAWGGEYGVVQGGKVQVDAPGVLADAAPSSQNAGPATVRSIIEQPQHGSLSMDNATGAFTYTPDADYSGLDWFTWQVADSAASGGYASVFIYVQALTPTISVGDLKEGDPTAQIPNDQFPPDAEGDPQYATINLNPGASLPNGSTVTLSVNSDVANDLDVYDGIPSQDGSNLLIGKDAGTDMYTWTIGDTPNMPSQVYAVGLAGTDYDQVTFALSVSVGTTEYGNSGDDSPDASPAAQPGSQPATTQASVPGKKGILEALDGTTDVHSDGTNVSKFADGYAGIVTYYHNGVGNRIDHPQPFGGLATIIWGDKEAFKIECAALTQLQNFYEDPAHRIVSLDVVGYSRGAMEAVKLVNDLSDAGLFVDPSDPDVIAPHFHPTVRFVGLISPVMGPFEIQGFWPYSLPAGPAWMYQALDNEPNNPILPQHAIAKEPGTRGSTVEYQDGHSAVGKDKTVLADMLAEAKLAGVPHN